MQAALVATVWVIPSLSLAITTSTVCVCIQQMCSVVFLQLSYVVVFVSLHMHTVNVYSCCIAVLVNWLT
jgi:hypothetical protein